MTPKYEQEVIPLYLMFCKDFPSFDYSPDAMESMYNHETYGEELSARNGYARGIKWMDVPIEMWQEDIRAGLLLKHELYGNYPSKFLDKHIGDVQSGCHALT